MKLPKIGQGTWKLGDDPRTFKEEVKSVRLGIENGLTLIDTAEMYGEGNSEILVGEAIKAYNREDIYIVSKVFPFNAGDNIYNALENSLDRLSTDYLDLYLLHWRGRIPLSETIYHMEILVEEGLIKNWGVSNFDIDDMKELLSLRNGKNCKVNQVLYNLSSRGIEYSLLPYLKKHDIEVMAYCPITPDKELFNKVKDNKVVQDISKKNDISIPQLLLAFINYRDDMIPIPRSSNSKHNIENAEMLRFNLPKEDYDKLDKEFPAPNYKTNLHIV